MRREVEVAYFSGTHPALANVLSGARMPAAAALRHGSRVGMMVPEAFLRLAPAAHMFHAR